MAIEKIIVLGSDLNFRSNLENYLRRCRYDVASARTIAMAREYLSRDNFDVIFLDFACPTAKARICSRKSRRARKNRWRHHRRLRLG